MRSPREAPTASFYLGNIVGLAAENEAFRRVVFTSSMMQVVVMAIPARGEVGEETHQHTEQALLCVSGCGEVVLDGKRSPFVPGDIVVVPPGIRHNIKSKVLLKIITVYTPPNHLPGRVHATKSEADADVEDEAVERAAAVRSK